MKKIDSLIVLLELRRVLMHELYIYAHDKENYEYTLKLYKMTEKSIKSFYSQEDYELGYIQSHDRNGNLQNFPFISLSIAGIDLSTHKYTSYLEINDALSIAKKHAKKIEGNSFYIEKIPNA